MKFTLVKLEKISGSRVTIYSAILEGEEHTLFNQFLLENLDSYRNELANLSEQIQVIAHKTGIRDSFFEKPEGKFGQDVWALFDKPRRRLRLYCMQLGHVIIILGSGGPKQTATLQEDPKLLLENERMRYISDAITKAIKEKDLKWTADGLDLEGSLLFGYPDFDE